MWFCKVVWVNIKKRIREKNIIEVLSQQSWQLSMKMPNIEHIHVWSPLLIDKPFKIVINRKFWYNISFKKYLNCNNKTNLHLFYEFIGIN